MKKIMLSIIPLLLLKFSTKAQEVKNIRYFDVDNKEISKSTFEEKRSSNTFLDIPGDSSNHHKLINREEKGEINDRTKLISLLESVSSKKIDSLKPMVIIYHPGQDNHNVTGNTGFIKAKYKDLEANLSKLYNVKPLYVYKEINGTNKYGSSINWIKDPEQMIEKHFFKYHYPSGSFVVIAKNGNYISYFGEYMNDSILDATKKLNK